MQPKFQITDKIKDATGWIATVVAVDYYTQEYMISDSANLPFRLTFDYTERNFTYAYPSTSPPPPSSQSSHLQQLKGIYKDTNDLFFSVDRNEYTPVPIQYYNEPKCECGGEKTYGKGTNLHADYCPLYTKP